MKLLWTTDLHLTDPSVSHPSGVQPEARLRQCIDHMLANHADAARLIISGDLAQKRDPGAYRLLANVLADNRIPVRLLVGNHDDRVALADAFRSITMHEGFVQDMEVVDGFQLIYLDTLSDGKHFGELNLRRLAWLEKALGDADGPAIISTRIRDTE